MKLGIVQQWAANPLSNRMKACGNRIGSWHEPAARVNEQRHNTRRENAQPQLSFKFTFKRR